MTASAFSLSTFYPSSSFELTKGEPTVGGLHGATRHFFCPHCMSWLFTHPESVDGFVNVRAVMLDDARDFSPFIETYTSEMLPWAKTPATHSFEKFPSMEQFQTLISDFKQQTAKIKPEV